MLAFQLFACFDVQSRHAIDTRSIWN